MDIKNYCWYLDYVRSTDDKEFVLTHFLRDYIFQHRLRYMIYFRLAQKTKSRIMRLFYDYKLLRLCRKYGIEIKSATKIGAGFSMIHPYNITVSPQAVLGRNCTMMKGSTVGCALGKRAGVPVIGDCVYIGL